MQNTVGRTKWPLTCQKACLNVKSAAFLLCIMHATFIFVAGMVFIPQNEGGFL